MSLPKELEDRLVVAAVIDYNLIQDMKDFLHQVIETDTGTGEYLESKAQDLMDRLKDATYVGK